MLAKQGTGGSGQLGLSVSEQLAAKDAMLTRVHIDLTGSVVVAEWGTVRSVDEALAILEKHGKKKKDKDKSKDKKHKMEKHSKKDKKEKKDR
jgi:hypothetical protein